MHERIRNRWAASFYDAACVVMAWLGAFWLRFNLSVIPPSEFHQAIQLLPIVLGVQVLSFWVVGAYRPIWRYISLRDIVNLLKAVLAGVAITMIVIFLITRLSDIPRSIFPLYMLLLLALVSAARLAYRWKTDHRLRLRESQRVIIVGAGRAGEMLARDLIRTPDAGCEPVGFVDDDVRKHGKEIHGARVLGSVSHLPELARELDAQLIMLAMPSASAPVMRRLVEVCESTGIPFRTLPALRDLTSGRAKTNALREVSIDDLLGRDPVAMDWTRIKANLAGKQVLVTGAGGSIGSELCRQILALCPDRLIIFDSCEYNLYRIERELLSNSGAGNRVSTVLGDVADRDFVGSVFSRYEPSVVFHAAAYKHVPLLEAQIRSAVRNNVRGTRVVADTAVEFGVATFVLISTDKAVNPTNVMGATKRVAEIYCQNLNERSNTQFVTVRFGNVLGSAGSVVPLFREQLAKGGPLTVTHPDITRYFMTIPEACQLIMQAATMGRGGEIFVLDMGEPTKISYLAEQLIRLAGKDPYKEIDIVYTGLRPGEKLFEELFHESEQLVGTEHEKILLARFRRVAWAELQDAFALMEMGIDQCDEGQLLTTLRQLVPEFRVAEDRRGADNVVFLGRSGSSA